jgi:hypothetical protein
MLFHDYSTLTGIARSAAREAAIVTGTEYSGIITFYEQQSRNTLTTLYTLKPNSPISIANEAQSDGSTGVRVRIKMVRTIDSYVLDVVTPSTFDIIYFMKKDTPTATPSGS